MGKNNGDAEAVKYIIIFMTFVFSLLTLFFLYNFVDEMFSLVLGASILVVLIFFVARRDTLSTVRTTLELSNENNKAMAEVEKYRQQAQIAQLRTFQEVLKSENKVREVEQRQSIKAIDKQPDFDRRLLTVNDRLLEDSNIDDGDFRIVEE